MLRIECLLCSSARSAHLLVTLVFHRKKQAQTSCQFRSLYLIDVHQALPYCSVLYDGKFALAALNFCAVLIEQGLRKDCWSQLVAVLPVCIKCCFLWAVPSAAVVIIMHTIIPIFWGKYKEACTGH